jgi:hypothetical protein
VDWLGRWVDGLADGLVGRSVRQPVCLSVGLPLWFPLSQAGVCLVACSSALVCLSEGFLGGLAG